MQLVSYHEALGRLWRAADERRLASIGVGLDFCVGRVAAHDLLAGEDVPPGPRVAMDGYAIQSAEVLCASPDAPITLAVTGSVAAGEPGASAGVLPRSALEVMTGAVLPDGFDAVVRREAVGATFRGERRACIEVRRPVDAGADVRGPGSDIAKGHLLASGGTVLTPAHVLALAAVGLGQVEVRARPRIALVATGREIVSPGSATLAEGQVRDATQPYLRAALARAGAEVVSSERTGDDLAELGRCLDRAVELEPDLVLSTGGASEGRHDRVLDAVGEQGGRVVFHGVAIRPGKPALLAELRGRAGTLGPVLFGLPGNPLASAVCLRFLVDPYLRELSGRIREIPQREYVRGPLPRSPGCRRFLAARRVRTREQEELRPIGAQGSFKTSALLQATAWISLTASGEDWPAGVFAEVYPLD